MMSRQRPHANAAAAAASRAQPRATVRAVPKLLLSETPQAPDPGELSWFALEPHFTLPATPLPTRSAYIGLGANLGDAPATLAAAWQALAQLPQSRGLALSGLYRSAPVDASGPDYVNAVAQLATALPATDLLDLLQGLETAFGRQRPFHHAPRTLDLDLLLLGDEVMQTPRLTLPHPRLHLRAFVLRPLLDLNPALQAPGLGTLADWLPGTADQRIEPVVPSA
jgi:2-amino-4-hydroxy-6-hydroxymethyldihydropteridine diphosphokinase